MGYPVKWELRSQGGSSLYCHGAEQDGQDTLFQHIGCSCRARLLLQLHVLAGRLQGVSMPGADYSAARDQPKDFHGAKVVEAFSVGLPWYWALPLSFALSPRIYKEVK